MPNPSPIRLILADDHQIVRAGIRQFIELESDLRVVAEADDGLQAITAIEQHRPDVAVLDIQMPGATGIEVTRSVRANRWPVGILVLTAYEEDPYVTAVLKAGANGYVLKSTRPPEIIQAIRDVYQGKTVVDQAVLPRVVARLSAAHGDEDGAGSLSERELEVLRLAARGCTNKAIAVQLSISDRTVQGHFAHIFEKIAASSRTEAVMKAVAAGLIPPGLPDE